MMVCIILSMLAATGKYGPNGSESSPNSREAVVLTRHAEPEVSIVVEGIWIQTCHGKDKSEQSVEEKKPIQANRLSILRFSFFYSTHFDLGQQKTIVSIVIEVLLQVLHG